VDKHKSAGAGSSLRVDYPAAGKSNCTSGSETSAAISRADFPRLKARVKLVPFPFVLESTSFAGYQENIAAKASVITTHQPITMANEVPSFTLPVVANPIAVSARVQSRKTSNCDAMKYQNGFSAAFMK
jgi:hypothetical protein